MVMHLDGPIADMIESTSFDGSKSSSQLSAAVESSSEAESKSTVAKCELLLSQECRWLRAGQQLSTSSTFMYVSAGVR